MTQETAAVTTQGGTTKAVVVLASSGLLFVHASDEVFEEGRFCISHRPTGYRLPPSFATVDEAIREMAAVAEWDWNFATPEDMPVETKRRGGEWQAARQAARLADIGATRIHVFGEEGDFEVWLDTDVAEQDGLCVGVGGTRAEALRDALHELRAHVIALTRMVGGGAA